jgi:hypothetical protein
MRTNMDNGPHFSLGARAIAPSRRAVLLIATHLDVLVLRRSLWRIAGLPRLGSLAASRQRGGGEKHPDET